MHSHRYRYILDNDDLTNDVKRLRFDQKDLHRPNIL